LVLSIIEEAKNIYHNGLDEYNDDEKVQQIKLENNNVYAFVQFLEEQGLDGFFDGETYDVSQTYGKYKEFIKQENYRNALPKVVFGRELRKEGIISVIKKTDGRSVRYYVRKDYTE
jgi:phage/plasmid-associated DNA primase